MRTLLAVWILCFGLGVGCASENRATEGDRQLSHQNKDAARQIGAAVGEAMIALTGAMFSPEGREKIEPALVFTKGAASDIEANASQQLVNWGPPKEPKPYTPKASDEARKKSEEDHKESPFWPLAASVIGTALGWAARATPLGNIPFLGKLIGALSPRLANGATKNEAITVALQVALDEGRDLLDKRAAELREKLADKPELAALIPDGHVLVDAIRRVLGDRNLLAANTALYMKNDTGVE